MIIRPGVLFIQPEGYTKTLGVTTVTDPDKTQLKTGIIVEIAGPTRLSGMFNRITIDRGDRVLYALDKDDYFTYKEMDVIAIENIIAKLESK